MMIGDCRTRQPATNTRNHQRRWRVMLLVGALLAFASAGSAQQFLTEPEGPGARRRSS